MVLTPPPAQKNRASQVVETAKFSGNSLLSASGVGVDKVQEAMFWCMSLYLVFVIGACRNARQVSGCLVSI